MTQPETADYRTLPPPIAPTTIAWQAWWEDHDTWDGGMLYADLDTAKRHSVYAYVGEEYSWMPGDDPDDEAPETVLTWELKYGRWRLLDGGQDTGVRLGETRTFAAPAGVAPAPDESWPSRRAGLRDEIVNALGRIKTIPPVAHRREQADHVLALLYREWPWLRAEAEDAVVRPASVDRADVYAEIADRLAADAEQGAKDGFTRINRRSAATQVREWGAELRRVVAETQAATCEPVQHAPGKVVLCPDCRAKGHSVCMSGETPTPCGPAPDSCDPGGEPCTDHEREQAHAEGEHCFCGPECDGQPQPKEA